MISRRRFLLFLGSCSATCAVLGAVSRRPDDTAARPGAPSLYLRDGWVLRVDDLAGDPIG